MVYSMIPFPVTLSDRWTYRRLQGHGVIIDALDILCAQLTRDLFAIAKFLLHFGIKIQDGGSPPSWILWVP